MKEIVWNTVGYRIRTKIVLSDWLIQWNLIAHKMLLHECFLIA